MMRADLRLVLGMLTEAAARGEPCPGNRALADALGLRGANAATSRVSALERAGHITVERLPAARIVTITATGARTAEPDTSRRSTSPVAREAVVMAMLAKAAAMGDLCPSNNVLAVAAGTAPSNAGRLVASLEARGLIHVERGRHGRRIVTIAATGEQTARPLEPWREARRRDISRLAEAMAQGAPSLRAAARRLGLSCHRAAVLWRQVRDELGWQAT